MEHIHELANYCLNCKTKPCQSGCPLGNNIPEFIKNVREENYEEAYRILSKTTVLQSICGRICPHMSQCMGKCVRGIKSNPVNIGEIEAFVGDMAMKYNYSMDGDSGMCENIDSFEVEKLVEEENVEELVREKEVAKLVGEKKVEEQVREKEAEKLVSQKDGSELVNKKRIAVVGGGPAGLTCASFLARSGFEVTIYERNDKLGGILRYGIPDFRLDKSILDNTINKILKLGIRVEYNKTLGIDISLEELTKEFSAVFISIGANIPWKMGIEGEQLEGVFGGNSLLEYSSHPNYEGKNIAVIGGGNVAMDCARTIVRMGAKKVTVIYRRAEEQMPAEKKEIEDAKKEGVNFLVQTNIVKIWGQEKVEKIECIKTELVQKEGQSRLVPVNIPDSNFVLDMDYVVMAIGSMADRKILDKIQLECDKNGYIKVDEKYRTSLKNVYAGGDVSGAKATVAWAARTGRDVANQIKEDLCQGLPKGTVLFGNFAIS